MVVQSFVYTFEEGSNEKKKHQQKQQPELGSIFWVDQRASTTKSVQKQTLHCRLTRLHSNFRHNSIRSMSAQCNIILYNNTKNETRPKSLNVRFKCIERYEYLIIR